MANPKTPSAGTKTCSFCRKMGHNARGCPVRKATASLSEEMDSEQVESEQVAEPQHAASKRRRQARDEAPVSEADVAAPAVLPPSDEEYEEYSRQVRLGDRLLRLTMREMASGPVDFVFQFPAEEMLSLDHGEAHRLYELLAWGLQKAASRKSASAGAAPQSPPAD